MTYANKDIYEGEWRKDLKDGEGTLKYHNGDVYDGEFKKDKMHGKGVYEYGSGDIIKSAGQWKEGKKSDSFKDIVRVTVTVEKQIIYDNDVKCEAPYDEDTDIEDYSEPVVRRRSKRRKVSVSPAQK